jgi:hypothetical protein
VRELPFDFDTGVTVSNGGWNAPLGDLARYAAFLAGAADDRVLRRATLEEMFRPQIVTDDPPVSAALGFFVEQRHGLTLVGHTGNQNGFFSRLYVHLPTRSAMIAAFNTDAGRAGAAGPQASVVLGDTLRDWFARHVFPALARR